MKVISFLTGLVLVFGIAFGVGQLFEDGSGEQQPSEHAHAESYSVVVTEARTESGEGPLRFTIEDEQGDVVTEFDVRHEKRLHLIAIGTGYADYQHLHPEMAADGTWSTPISLAPGNNRLYADFRPAGGEDAVATADLTVSGAPASPAYSLLRSQQVEGYTVTAIGELEAGQTSAVRFEIARHGAPVRDLQPYLGAYGHLVMLRADDGEYLHVHPEEGPAGPTIAFEAEAPTRATYHLYLDFKHGGKVRTAHFVIDAAGAAPAHDDMGGTSHGDH